MITAAKSGKDQVEPDHVRPKLADRPEQLAMVGEPVLTPAPLHTEFLQFGFGLIRRQLVCQYREADQRVCLQLLGHVKTILIEHTFAGRKSANEANLHRVAT